MKKRYLGFMCLGTAVLLGLGLTQPQSGNVFAPDLIQPLSAGVFIVANRSAAEIVKIDGEASRITGSVKLDTPANDILVDEGTIWVVTDGVKGKLYAIDPAGMSIKRTAAMGYSPSSITKNPATGKLWVTQRFNNQVWEVDPASGEVAAKVDVGREPVDAVIYAGDSKLLVVNNLPETPANAFPVCASLDIVDMGSKSVTGRIELPNGSTDVRNIATDPEKSYAYITHLLSRYQIPTNQVDRGWIVTNVMSIVDLATDELVTTVLLDTPQRGAANPSAITVTEDGEVIAVALCGSHEIARIDRSGLHDRIDMAKEGEQVVPSFRGFDHIPNDAGFLYDLREFIPTGGNGPRCVTAVGDNIYTANYFSGELVAIAEGKVVKSASFGSPLGKTPLGMGEKYFHDASICFQQWMSCASCHPNDARVDGMNWDLLNDGPGTLKQTKSLLYSHFTPPTTVTGIRANAPVSVRKGIEHTFFAKVDENIPASIDKWLMSLKAIPSPLLVDGKLSEAAVRGKIHFDRSCASCHSGQYYTDMKQYKVSWATGKDKEVPMDVPALTEVWRTAPYLYDGRSYTMREMLDAHGPAESLTDDELNDLAEYVLSL